MKGIKFTYCGADGEKHSFLFDRSVTEAWIGAGPECAICVSGKSVLARHARLFWRNGHVFAACVPGCDRTLAPKVDGMRLDEGGDEVFLCSELVVGDVVIFACAMEEGSQASEAEAQPQPEPPCCIYGPPSRLSCPKPTERDEEENARVMKMLQEIRDTPMVTYGPPQAFADAWIGQGMKPVPAQASGDEGRGKRSGRPRRRPAQASGDEGEGRSGDGKK
ncbi:MAG: FHA domain-containing protein [Proteobacteria bacterium]|nr:FHA domain-containing protein [Pseudomonadota bacterium]